MRCVDPACAKKTLVWRRPPDRRPAAALAVRLSLLWELPVVSQPRLPEEGASHEAAQGIPYGHLASGGAVLGEWPRRWRGRGNRCQRI